MLALIQYQRVTDRRTDGQTDGHLCSGYSWARTRGAQLSAGYTINTHKMYAPHILMSPAPHCRLFIAQTATDRHATRLTTTKSDSTQLKAGNTRACNACLYCAGKKHGLCGKRSNIQRISIIIVAALTLVTTHRPI